jgi:glycosyltransferase involved in cell wall biosynthesis
VRGASALTCAASGEVNDESQIVLLSIVMPVYNEGATLREVISRLGAVDMPVPWELIVVDDGSTDGAVDEVSSQWAPVAERVLVVQALRNQGKGAALRRGFELARGDIIGVQDADLEYDPVQIPGLIRPILDGDADAVFGTRQFGANASYSFWYTVGNRLISLAASMLFDRLATDAYTCYKFFRREQYEAMRLTADGFEIEAELTGAILGSDARYHEVPISYQARSREAGKKIHPRDGVVGILRLLRVRARGW